MTRLETHKYNSTSKSKAVIDTTESKKSIPQSTGVRRNRRVKMCVGSKNTLLHSMVTNIY